MKIKIALLSLTVALFGVSISHLAALPEIEDCPLGSNSANCAVGEDRKKLLPISARVAASPRLTKCCALARGELQSSDPNWRTNECQGINFDSCNKLASGVDTYFRS